MRFLPYIAALALLGGLALALRHSGAEAERRRQEAAQAATLRHSMEVRTDAETAAAGAADPAADLMRDWRR